MNKKLPKLTVPEFEIMKVVWERDQVTINEVLDAVNPLYNREEKSGM